MAEPVIRLYLVPELVLVAGANLAVAADFLDLDATDGGSRRLIKQVEWNLLALRIDELARVATRDGVHLAQHGDLADADFRNQALILFLDSRSNFRSLKPFMAHNPRM